MLCICRLSLFDSMECFGWLFLVCGTCDVFVFFALLLAALDRNQGARMKNNMKISINRVFSQTTAAIVSVDCSWLFLQFCLTRILPHTEQETSEFYNKDEERIQFLSRICQCVTYCSAPFSSLNVIWVGIWWKTTTTKKFKAARHKRMNRIWALRSVRGRMPIFFFSFLYSRVWEEKENSIL